MYSFCLQADRPLTGGLISGGGGGLLSRGGACNRLYVFLFTGRWAYNWWGRVISGGGGRLYPGGPVIGCIFCLQIDGGLVSGGGEGAYIREACNQMYFFVYR